MCIESFQWRIYVNDIPQWKLIKWLNGISGTGSTGSHTFQMNENRILVAHSDKVIATIILLLFKLNALDQHSKFETEWEGKRTLQIFFPVKNNDLDMTESTVKPIWSHTIFFAVWCSRNREK